MTWTNPDAYACPTCGGSLRYLTNDDGESMDEPMQCVAPTCAAVVACDMDTGEWFDAGSDPDRAATARSTS